jgi:hypothetical protein
VARCASNIRAENSAADNSRSRRLAKTDRSKSNRLTIVDDHLGRALQGLLDDEKLLWRLAPVSTASLTIVSQNVLAVSAKVIGVCRWSGVSPASFRLW